MVRINVRHDVSSVRVEIGIELDVHNYEEIARKEHGSLAGVLSSFSLVRRRIDSTIHDRVQEAVSAGLAARLRPELIARIEESITNSIRDSLVEQLGENGVEADVHVTVAAR